MRKVFYLFLILSFMFLTGLTLKTDTWKCDNVSKNKTIISKCEAYLENGKIKVIYEGETRNNEPFGKGILTIPIWPKDYIQGIWNTDKSNYGGLHEGVIFINGEKIFVKNGKMVNKPSTDKKIDSTTTPIIGKKNSLGGLFAVLLSFIVIPVIVFFPLNILYRSTSNSFLRGSIIVGGIIIFYFIFANFQNQMNVNLNDPNCKPSYWRSC